MTDLFHRQLAIILPLLVATSSCDTSLQDIVDDTDVAVVWRGFTHAWDVEAHRTGRFGNWVEVDTDGGFPRAFSTHHLARAGSNIDDATFSTRYDVVQATGVRFISGSTVLEIDAEEEELVDLDAAISIALDSDPMLEDKQVFAALINGFALRSDADSTAKKLGRLVVALSTPTRDSDSIDFNIDVTAMLSCKSTECDLDEGISGTDVAYTVEIHWLLVAGTDASINVVAHDTVGAAYVYASGQGVDESPGSLSGDPLTPPLANGWTTYTTGMRGFDFDVEKNVTLFLPDSVPHLYMWKMWADPVGALPIDPTVNGQAFFAHHYGGGTNLGHQGEASVEIDLLTVQIDTGLKETCETSGTESFGNANNGDEEVVSEGAIADKGELSCL
jgi:hypothetical protein